MSHYVVKVYGFECDVPGCEASVEVIPHAGSRRPLDNAREQVAQVPDRWSHVEGLDICDRQDAAHATAREGWAS